MTILKQQLLNYQNSNITAGGIPDNVAPRRETGHCPATPWRSHRERTRATWSPRCGSCASP